MSQSRVLRAPGTLLYHLVPKQFQTTWSRPEQSHLLPEACSIDGADNGRQRQRRTKRPPPKPSDILKRYCALYNYKWQKRFLNNLFIYLFSNGETTGYAIQSFSGYTIRRTNNTASLTLYCIAWPVENLWFQLKFRNNSRSGGLINIDVVCYCRMKSSTFCFINVFLQHRLQPRYALVVEPRT